MTKNGDGRVVYLSPDRRYAIVSDADLRTAAVLLADGYNHGHTRAVSVDAGRVRR
jgi:hypothetical protein